MLALIQRDSMLETDSPEELGINAALGGNLCATPYNNRVERIARGHHGLCSVGQYGVGLTAHPALVPYGLVRPGRRPPAVLTAHSSVIRAK